MRQQRPEFIGGAGLLASTGEAGNRHRPRMTEIVSRDCDGRREFFTQFFQGRASNMFRLQMGEPVGRGNNRIGCGSFPAACFQGLKGGDEQLLALSFEDNLQFAAGFIFNGDLGGDRIEGVHAEELSSPGIGQCFGGDDADTEAGEGAWAIRHGDERDGGFGGVVPDFLNRGGEGFGRAGIRWEAGFGDECVALEQGHRTCRCDGFNRYSPPRHTDALSRKSARNLATPVGKQAIIGVRGSLLPFREFSTALLLRRVRRLPILNKVFGSFRLAGTVGWQQRGRSNDSWNVPSLVCQNSIGKGAPA